MSVPPAVKVYVPEWKRQFEQKGWWHSFELPDGTTIEGVNTVASLKERAARFPIPQDLRGRRVLDIGAWDGWFTFEMERRGAEVMAIDRFDSPRFREIHAILGSRAEYRQMDVFEISPQTVGRFDYVLFLGVLYHLKHPLLALEKVCAVATDLAVVESFILRDSVGEDARPMLEFYESNELGGQFDNWCAPNLACLTAMCRTAGFARVDVRGVHAYGACVACYRHWEPGNPAGPRVEMLSAAHPENAGINFDSRRDEYLVVRFRTSERDLGRHGIQPRVGGYGVVPLGAADLSADPSLSGIWQAIFRLPPGLTPGWHEVTVAVHGGPESGGIRVAVDVPVPPCWPRIEGLADGVTWTDGVLDLARGRIFSLWCADLPENADHANLHVMVDGMRWPAQVIDGPAPSYPELRQVNVTVPEGVSAGRKEVTVRIGGSVSAPAPVEIRAESL
jgi:tRNA (mo5U34)-methyltransferase